MGKVKYAKTSKEWSKLDSLVYNLIKSKIVAYKQEVELNLELEGYGNRDVGLALQFLSEKAPFVHLRTIVENPNGRKTLFFYSEATKEELVIPILQQKLQMIEEYTEIARQCGNWMDKVFLPRSFHNSGFIVEAFRATNYNYTEYKGDIDIILNPQRKSDAKIFIEVKNKLTPFRNHELNKFFSRLRKFSIKIIAVVIARKIYEGPKERLEDLNGSYIELNKVMIKDEFKEFSKIYNKTIAPITRVIANNIFPPPDIKKKLKILEGLEEGTIFSKLPSNVISPSSDREEYEQDVS